MGFDESDGLLDGCIVGGCACGSGEDFGFTEVEMQTKRGSMLLEKFEDKGDVVGAENRGGVI